MILNVLWWYFLCVVCVCMCFCVSTYEGAYGGQRSAFSSCLQSSLFFFLRQVLSLSLEPIGTARLARKQTPGISLFPQLKHWGYRCVQPCPVLYKATKNTFRYPCFPRKHFPIETLPLLFDELCQRGRQRAWDNEDSIIQPHSLVIMIWRKRQGLMFIRGKEAGGHPKSHGDQELERWRGWIFPESLRKSNLQKM